jgi:hypothetical protein
MVIVYSTPYANTYERITDVDFDLGIYTHARPGAFVLEYSRGIMRSTLMK